MFNKKIFLAALLMCVGTGMAASEPIAELYQAMQKLSEAPSLQIEQYRQLQTKDTESLKAARNADLMNEINNLYNNPEISYMNGNIEAMPEEAKELVDACYDACAKIDFYSIIETALSAQGIGGKEFIVGACRDSLYRYRLPEKSDVVRKNHDCVCGFIERLSCILSSCEYFKTHERELDAYGIAKLASIVGTELNKIMRKSR